MESVFFMSGWVFDEAACLFVFGFWVWQLEVASFTGITKHQQDGFVCQHHGPETWVGRSLGLSPMGKLRCICLISFLHVETLRHLT